MMRPGHTKFCKQDAARDFLFNTNEEKKTDLLTSKSTLKIVWAIF